MGAYLGNTEIGKMFLGSTEIGQAYLGSTKVWESKQLLPYDAEIEYLESSGKQWIDTGLVFKSNLHILFSVIYNNYGSNLLEAWGCNSNDYEVLWGLSGSSRFYFGGGYSDYHEPIQGTEYNMDYDFTVGNMVAKVNGEVVRSTQGTQPNRSLKICIFALDDKSTQILPYKAKHKAFKIYDDNILVRDFVPVRVGQVGYMYDKVSGQLFGNNGTGNFTLGNDITT